MDTLRGLHANAVFTDVTPEELEEMRETCEHEFDPDEGYTCLNCGEQGDIGSLTDRAIDRMEDR